MAKDDKIILTPAEAESLLAEGETVHNFVNPGMNLLVGCDFDRKAAIERLQNALQIEIGGEQCKRMKHAIVVWDSETHCSFFEADMAKVESFEAART